MTAWILALKRLLRPAAAIMLAVTILLIWAAGLSGAQVSLRPCGIVCEDPAAAELKDALTAKGFVPFGSRAEMEQAIADGALDCGAVLLPGIAEGAVKNELDGSVILLSAPDAFLTEVYQAHIHATLYTVSGPQRTVQGAAAADIALDPDRVRSETEALRKNGYLFRFETERINGGAPDSRDLGIILAQAAAALLLFAAIVPGTGKVLRDAEYMAVRIGRPAALLRILLPTLLWQALLFTLAAVLPLGGHVAATAGYVLLLTALGLIAARLPFRTDLLIPIMLLGSLALYPIYFDLAAMIPQAGLIRLILPPCWFPAILSAPVPALLCGAAICAALLCLFPVRRHL